MGYNFTELLESSSRQETYDIPIAKEQLVFLIKSGRSTIAQKFNEKLEDVDGGKAIRLPKRYDISVKEFQGLRNDRYNDARRKELLAAIGEAKRCSLTVAEKTFSNQSEWKSLPQELQDELSGFFVAALVETQDSTLTARQVTTLIQSRLFSDWQLEWTLQLPGNIFDSFLAYFEGENSKWENEEKPQSFYPSNEGKTVEPGLTSTSSQLLI